MRSAQPKCPLLQCPPQPLPPTPHGRTGSGHSPPPSLSHCGREEPRLPTAAKAVVVRTVGSSIPHCSLAEQPALSSSTAFVSGSEAGEPAIRCNNTDGSLSPHRENGKRARAAFGCQEQGSSHRVLHLVALKVSQSGGLSPSTRQMLANLLPRDPTYFLFKKIHLISSRKKRSEKVLWGKLDNRPSGFFS